MYALTMNNLGCYYKKVRKPNVAYQCLKTAFEMEQAIEVCFSHLASTKLNTCAVLSQMGKHKAALEEAKEALHFLLKAIKTENDPTGEIFKTTAFCYFNKGVEHEHLKKFREALDDYCDAQYFAKQCGLEQLFLGVSPAIERMKAKLEQLNAHSVARASKRRTNSVERTFNDSYHLL